MNVPKKTLFLIICPWFLPLAFFFFPLPSLTAAEAPPPPAHTRKAQEQQKPDHQDLIEQLKETPPPTTAPIKTEQIDRAGEEIGNRLQVMGKKMSPFLGSWIETELFWGITGLKLAFSVFIFLCVLLGERLLAYLIRRRLRQEKDFAASVNWRFIFLRGISRPLALFIWIYGTYAALSPLFSHLAQPGLAQGLHRTIKWTTDLGGTIIVLWFVYRILHLLDFHITRWAGLMQNSVGPMVLAFAGRLRNPVRMLILLLFFRLIAPLLDLSPEAQIFTGQIFGLLLIAVLACLVIQAMGVVENLVLSRYDMRSADNLSARKMHTQVRFIKRLLITVVVIIAGASMLMVFDKVRQLGTSILASAGLVGIVVGLAAQRSISNILVGLQIALTQPIRLDDVVIIEEEWGRIEEITMTYIVVKLWDSRRLIVPSSYFTEKPFQNWTRVSAELLGTVFLYLDYTVPVAALRQELQRILQGSKLWNGKVGLVQVTDTTAQAMEIRLLLSADDASLAWDLRCEVREKMIAFIQAHYPESLPKIRGAIQPGQTGKDEEKAADTRGNIPLSDSA
jgi:small-conductance mechanosensitive channel